MENQKTKTKKWFWFVSIFFLLWNLLGVLSFFFHAFISANIPEDLPENEKALYGEYPLWTYLVFAMAVLGGIIGSIGLVMRKKWSRTAFIISLLAVIPQMTHNVFFTSAIEVYGITQAVTMPILVVVFAAFLVWFSDLGIKKGWLD